MTPDNVLYTLFCRADGSAEIAMELSHKSQKKGAHTRTQTATDIKEMQNGAAATSCRCRCLAPTSCPI